MSRTLGKLTHHTVGCRLAFFQRGAPCMYRRVPSLVQVRLEASYVCRVSTLNEKQRLLLWRARRKRWVELDEILGPFVERHIKSMSEVQLEKLKEVLDVNNGELLRVLGAVAPLPPALVDNEVMVSLLKYVNLRHPALRDVKTH
uniref:Succinate dehydrogenase assembly factor 2, mitochondrial n=1 Tax=Noctiluca scintillans TaxID=2966 RepID=A0A7S1ABQ8_NOCSC|mmetsp:Transcript_39863/g.105724  ORF Transcript_39863/g.105724 Transcript_39863/m.105724 type:complete len:144 (+) Transcript_39863:42-473(+)